VTAQAVNADEIDLHWAATGKGIDGYRVSRDGAYMNFIEATSFTNTSVKPSTTYSYSVSLRDTKGHYLPGAAATARTPAPPPLSQARLDGSFMMRMRYTLENYTNRKVGDRFRESWRFTPRCDTGPCSVGLRTNRGGEHRARLTRAGAAYVGSGTDTLFSCDKVRGTEKFSVSLHVTRARFVDGEWVATSVSGTTAYDAPAFNGCAEGHAKAAAVGARVSA
jgi:hypothetical protein